jgi:hypothetical protein
MPERVVLLKGLHMRCEVSGNLMIYDPRKFTLGSHFRFEPTDWRMPRQRRRQLILCRAFHRPNSFGFRCPKDSIQVAGAREMIVPRHQKDRSQRCNAHPVGSDGIYLPTLPCSARSSALSLIYSLGKAKKDHRQSH